MQPWTYPRIVIGPVHKRNELGVAIFLYVFGRACRFWRWIRNDRTQSFLKDFESYELLDQLAPSTCFVNKREMTERLGKFRKFAKLPNDFDAWSVSGAGYESCVTVPQRPSSFPAPSGHTSADLGGLYLSTRL